MVDDHNINFAKCLQTANDFGVQHIHNVCSGTVTDVPWGSADWVIAILLGLFGAVVVALFASMAVAFIREAF